jgi:poly-gamma-glutamate capsule biosynthesis protein CapA/YwtB (metallophosphatase superfamily)
MKLLIKYTLAAVVFGFSLFVFTKITADHPVKSPTDDDRHLSLLFMGDIMQHQPQIEAAWDDSLKTYIYDSCFKYMAPLIRSADIAMANLEVTLGGSPYTGYPQFSAPDKLVNALLYAGIDIVGTANNHSCDRGSKGIERTIHVLDSMGMKHTGTFTDSVSRSLIYPLMVQKNGFKLALLNYTYGTNGIEVPLPNVVNLIDTNIMMTDLKRAKDSLPDKTIVFIHWGDEYKSYPNQFQQDIARLCFANGADIIIGMHPHVIQKIERLNFPDSNGREVFIAYSLGNYISDQRGRFKDGGLMVRIDLLKHNNVVNIDNSGWYLSWVYTPVENDTKKYYILPVNEFESKPNILDTISYQKMMLFATDSRTLMQKESIGSSENVFDLETNLWRTK